MSCCALWIAVAFCDPLFKKNQEPLDKEPKTDGSQQAF